MGDTEKTLDIRVEYDDLDRVFIAQCVNLPACSSYGATVREALENLAEALAGVLDSDYWGRPDEARWVAQGTPDA